MHDDNSMFILETQMETKKYKCYWKWEQNSKAAPTIILCHFTSLQCLSLLFWSIVVYIHCSHPDHFCIRARLKRDRVQVLPVGSSRKVYHALICTFQHLAPPPMMLNAAFRLALYSLHCWFWWWYCTTAKAPLAREGWPSGKQHLANTSKTCHFVHSSRPQTVELYSTWERYYPFIKPMWRCRWVL